MKLYAAPSLIIAAGALLVASVAGMPAYSDPNWQERFLKVDVSLENSDALSVQWYAAKAAAETPRNRRLDLGMGLIALGVGLSVLFAAQRVRSVHDLKNLKSPATSRRFYLLAAATWLSFIPAEWFWLGYTQGRGDYPWWADSIGIPSGGVLIFGIIGLPAVLLGVALALRRAILPVSLWTLPAFGPPYVVCAGLNLAGVLALLVLVSGISTEPFLVPSALFTLYLLLSGRSAAIGGRHLTRRIWTPPSSGI